MTRVRVLHERIYLDATGTKTDALAIENGRIIAIGDAAKKLSVDHEKHPQCACLFPALTDAHIHMWGLGLRANVVDLRPAQTTSDVYDALNNGIVGEHGWLLGRDWEQRNWSDIDRLDISKLDQYDAPMCLWRVDRHAVWVNHVALKRAGISSETVVDGGRIEVVDGKVTGLLVDAAMDLVLDLIEEPTVKEDQAIFFETAEMLKSFGISSAHIAWLPLNRISMLTDLRDTGELPMRLHTLMNATDPAIETFVNQTKPHRDKNAWLNLNGMKFFADGAFGSKGALLIDTYADGSSGLEVVPNSVLRKQCVTLSQHGWQIATHAIGDLAARRVLDVYAQSEVVQNRHRIEHAQMVADPELQKLKNIIASIQPIHLHSDVPWITEDLSADQIARLFRWNDLREASDALPGGSDFPIDNPNPWHGIAAAMTQRSGSGDVFRDSDKLSRQHALAAYTSEAAYSAFWENDCGSLRPGFVSDFIELDFDIFEATADDFWNVEPDQVRLHLAGQTNP